MMIDIRFFTVIFTTVKLRHVTERTSQWIRQILVVKGWFFLN